MENPLSLSAFEAGIDIKPDISLANKYSYLYEVSAVLRTNNRAVASL